MNKSITEIFPRASKSFLDCNPATLSHPVNKNDVQVKEGGKKRGSMNKTESEYALILEAMKRKGEILRAEYEGITLRWADMRYTPDFVVFEPDERCHAMIRLIEVKGGHIWDRDIVRFKGARAYWPEFRFEMQQRKKGVWRRIY